MSADDDDRPTGAGPGKPEDAERRGRPPPTIDLAAERVATKAGASGRADAPTGPTDAGPDPMPPPPPIPPRPPEPDRGTPRRTSAGALVAAGVVGGVIATVLGIAWHASGIVPTRSEIAAREALAKIDALSVAVDGLDSRIAAVEAAPPSATAAELAALADRLSGLETQERENRARIAALEARPAGPADGGGADLAGRLGAVEDRLGRVETEAAAFVALRDRLAAAEASLAGLAGRIDALAARPDPGAASEQAARAIAVAMLRQAAVRGGPFADDLATLAALGVDTPELRELAPLAAKDTPGVAALGAAFPPVAGAILAATRGTDPDAGFLARLVALGSDLVTVRPIAAVEGETPVAVVSRMQAAVDRGDLAAALAERTALPAEGQAASAAWAASAADRLAIDGLIEKLAQSVVAPGN